MRAPCATTVAAALALVACGRGDHTESAAGEVVPPATIEEVRVTGLALGRRLRASGEVAGETSAFGPADTIVAVVHAERAAPGQRLDARWTTGDDERLVAEQTQTVAATTGAARAVFALPPAPAWAPGHYRLRIMNGAKELAGRRFEVR